MFTSAAMRNFAVLVTTFHLSLSLPLFPRPVRPFNCSATTDSDAIQLKKKLEWSNLQLGNLILPINVTYDKAEDTLYVLNHVYTHRETPFLTCHGIEDQTTEISRNALCSWKYSCDHDSSRFPAYIFHAKCSSGEQHYLDRRRSCQCTPLTVSLKVLKFQGCQPSSGQEIWSLMDQVVDVGCTCMRTYTQNK
jgi:hypothetical protein